MGLHLGTRRALLYRPRAAANLRALRFDGTGDYVDCGSGATIDDLHAGAMTVEMWCRITPGTAGDHAPISKDVVGAGWYVYWGSGGGGKITALVNADTNATIQSTATVPASLGWMHLAVTYDNGGDRLMRAFVNGTQLSYSTQIAAVGTIKSDAGYNLYLGGLHQPPNWNKWIGDIAWVRLSNVVRYTDTFTPQPLATPPDTDANTVLLLKMDEGSGTTVTDSSGNGNHGTLYGDTTWVAL